MHIENKVGMYLCILVRVCNNNRDLLDLSAWSLDDDFARFASVLIDKSSQMKTPSPPNIYLSANNTQI